MAGNFRASAGIEPAQSRTAVQGSYVPVRQAQAPAPQAAYGLAYQMGGPNYMYGVTPRFGAYYRDGGMPPGQIHGNMPGSREGADMFGFWPTMFQSSPYATASQMYTPGLGVMPLIGYPSRYPHVIMGGYSDYGAGIGNQAMGMMLPLLMMGLYRQMFPMSGMPGAAGGAGGRGGAGGGGKSGGGSESKSSAPAQTDTSKYAYKYHYPGTEPDYKGFATPSAYYNPAWRAQRDLVGPFAPDNYEGNGLYYHPNEGYIRPDQASGYAGGPLHRTAPDIPPLAPPVKSNIPLMQRTLGINPDDISATEAQDTPIVYRDYTVYSPNDAN